MHSSEAMGSVLQDRHLLDRPRPTTAARYLKKSGETRKRPATATPERSWQNPNAVKTKPMKKVHVSLYHTPLESKVSKKAPFAPRPFQGQTSYDLPKVVNGKKYTMPEYNPIDDPHLQDYYARKLGLKASLSDSAKKKLKDGKKKATNTFYDLMVTTGNNKGCGTDARVYVQLRGTKGKLSKQQLTRKAHEDGLAALSSNPSPFKFVPGSTENFSIRAPDIGDLIALEVEHDGLERNQSWYLEEIRIANRKTQRVTVFPCQQWLSLYDGDCQVKRILKPASSISQERIVYEIKVLTGDKRGAGTDAHVLATLFGDRGQTPRVQLVNRSVDTFERGKTDIFKVKTKSLGRLQKLIIEHDNTGFAPGWYLDKVIITNLNNPKELYYFPCDKWLSKDEGDGQIMRQLLGTKSLDNVQQDYKYKVLTYTGNVRGAGTDANVYITVFGKDGDSGQHKLNSSKNNFERGKIDAFEMACPPLGSLRRIRIGHDNKGVAAGWFLDKVIVQDAEGHSFEFPCGRWLSKTEDDGKISRELLVCGESGLEGPLGDPYHVHVTTGDVRGAGTSARVFIILYGGDEGELNSGKLWLENDKKDNFERGRTDIFTVECIEQLSPLHHITVGHDNSGAGAGWHLEKVVVDSSTTGIVQTFFSRKWLADDEDDNLIERDLYEDIDWRQQREIKEVWNAQVWTSDILGAGTDANVYMTLYGDKGKSEETILENETNNFERGTADRFKVELKSVGKPYKLRIRHDDSKPFSDWHLEKIEMEHVRTKRKYLFECGRWLSNSEDDGQIVRELPAKGKGIDPLQVLLYPVFVYTGSKRGAGTNANVFIDIFGERGDTGNRPLLKSKSNRNKFERNQMDEFLVEAVSLSDLTAIRIGHDGSGSSDGWFLDKVIIQDPEHEEKKFTFICNRWLATDEDDGQIVRELPVGEHGTLLKTTTYHVSVKTGDVRGAGTDANAYIHLFGENGDTGRLKLKQSENTKNKFERARTDMFSVEAMDIGKLSKILVGHDGKGIGSGWFVDSVTVDVPSRGENVIFPCHRWLAEDEDDGLIERELYPSEERVSSKKIPYEVTICTGDIRGAGTNANVFLVLYGDKGKSDEFWLRNKTDNFERGQVDKFKVESDEIGPLTKIRVGHDNSGFGSAWYLEKIEIRRLKIEGTPRGKGKKKKEGVEEMGDDDDCNYLFMCNRWFAKDEDDKQIVRELVPTDATGTRARSGSLPNTNYTIHVFTGDVSGSGTNSNVFATLYGEHGDSGERQLAKSETHMDKFERNQEDIFRIECISLGTLNKFKIRHDNSGMKSAWFLDRIEVNDEKEREDYIFPCNRWLATGEDDGQICRELVPVNKFEFERRKSRRLTRKMSTSSSKGDTIDLEQKASVTTYEVHVTTGDIRGAGTDANVFVTLFGENGDSGKTQLKTSKTNKNKFERNQTDVFSVEAVDIGSLSKIRIGHDNKGGFAGWYLDKVEVDAPSLGQRWIFPAGRWLDKGKDDGKLEIDLYPAEEREENYNPHVPYEITVHTSDQSGGGTDANVFIVLYGMNGICTEQVDLTDSKKKRKECFNRGSVDVFVRELDDVGDVIEKVRIGHDGKGIGSGWHLNKVEVRRLNEDGSGSTTYTFPCNRWLAKGEDDGAIVRELVPSKIVEETVDGKGNLETEEKRVDALTLHNYKIHVFTGNVKHGGTDANVFLTLYGENGDSGERQLSKSETHTDKFERGQEDIFNWECVDLGYIRKAFIRHDNSKLNPSWHLDRIEVVDTTQNNKKYQFLCERWLSKKKDDGKIKKNLYEKNYGGDRSSVSSHRSSFRGSSLSLDRESLDSVDVSPRSPTLSRKGSTVSKKSRRSSTADKIFKDEFEKLKRQSRESLRGRSASMGSLLETIPYTIRIATGDKDDEGTDANVHIVLIGTDNVSEKIPLELIEKDEFAAKSVETFSVEAPDVGEIKKIELGHDGYRPQDSWYVKEVEIDVPTTGRKYHFPCQCWFGKDKEDGKTARILSVTDDQIQSYKPKIPYEMTVYTGDVKSAGTDSQISVTFFGTGGSSSETKLSKEEDRFERASVDIIRIEIEDIGTLTKLRIGHDGKGSRPAWFLERIMMRNLNTDKVTTFKCNRWLSKTEEDGQLVRELPAEVGGKKVIQETTYKLNVHTGDVRGGGTDANVFLIIFGEKGDSGELALKNSETNKDKFERNQTDTFTFNMLSLGELIKVRIWHDNKYLRSGWYLKNVDIEDQSTKKTYDFPCNRWLAKDEDDGSLVRELPCANRDESSQKSPRDVTGYEVTFVTTDKQNAGTAHNAWVVLTDDKGNKSKEILIKNKPPKSRLFSRGETDTVKIIAKPLGTLNKLTVGHRLRRGATQKGSLEEQKWHLHEVTVKNLDSEDSYTFLCQQWIPLSQGKEGAVHLKCSAVDKSRLSKSLELLPIQYEVKVYTGDIAHAGTDANVSINIFGENGDTGKRQLKKKFKDLFERGQVDDFKVEALDLGQLTKVIIEHDNKGFGAGWFLQKVEITDLKNNVTTVFPCNQWLDKKKGDKEICRELLPAPVNEFR